MIRKTRTLTDKPFGVGVVLAFPHKENIKAILDEKVAVLQISWGECSQELLLEARRAGVKVIPQVSVFYLFLFREKIIKQMSNAINYIFILQLFLLQVGSFEEAKRAVDASVDAIIVQGLEAGGHVIGQVYYACCCY